VQREVRPVHKDGLLAAVPMDVNEASDWVGLRSVGYDIFAQIFDVINYRVQLGVGRQELSI